MKIAEIFHSIQGEGRRQGYLTTFVRCAGCNLSCRWCDSPASRGEGTPIPAGEVLWRVRGLPGRAVCITGGEPLLQQRELLTLVEYLHDDGYTIEIETNGTISFAKFQDMASITMDVKCPSSGAESDLALLDLISPRDTVKFVIGGHEDCTYAVGVLAGHRVRGEVVFSPVHGTDPHAIASFILAHEVPVRLQLQLHKIVGVP